MTTHKYSFVIAATLLLCISSYSLTPTSVTGQEANRETELRSLIDERTDAISKLEIEITRYQNQLREIDSSKKTLQNEIRSLDLTRKKLVADLGLTENKIGKTNYELEALAIDINDKEDRIGLNRDAMAEGLRIIHDHDNRSLLENLLSTDELSLVWEDIESIEILHRQLAERIDTLSNIKNDLEGKQALTAKKKKELEILRADLSGKKKAIEYNTQQKNSLLSLTKNNEANYKKLLDQKVALRDAFEKELLEIESELRLLIDPSSIPDAAAGLLSWPVQDPYLTQEFGNTAFSRSNPQAYNGRGHNGIDLRASVGSPIFSASDGEVVGVGDTDAVCPNASYGKWILIKHPNGLSTLYAHLSVISVSSGSQVARGETIGYSGNSGYSTGPHLHFTVYATQGVQIAERKSRVCRGTYRMPIADLRAYLNPLSYLPEL